MHSRTWTTAIVAAVLITFVRTAAAADEVTLLRVFLTDGSSMVSFGEPARVGERVIFSMPTSSTPDSPLQLVDIPAGRVDWDRTNRYAASARASHYVETQAESDYATLSIDVTQTLNDVALTTDPVKRLAIVERARRVLSDWPQTHFNYRAAEVRQMLAMLDEAIVDLRAATGGGRFSLSLTAFADPPATVEPLLPPPTLRESIEQVRLASRAVDSAAERTVLLKAALGTLARNEAALPAEWASTTRGEVEAELQTELRLDRAYGSLTKRFVTLADRSARAADVKGLQWLLTRVRVRDAALGSKRPDAVIALVAAVEEKLDAARRLQLARDRWRLRAAAIRSYRVAIRAPIDEFAALKPSLENIKTLAGSTPASLDGIRNGTARILKLTATITPPEETTAAHALFITAVQLAANAAQIREEAALAGNIARAWDASSAAAGSLMLGAKARTDIQVQLRLPQLNSPR